MSKDNQEITTSNFKDSFKNLNYSYTDIHQLIAKPENILEIVKELKKNMGFNMLIDICGIDYAKPVKENHNKRFCSVYHFLNMETHQRCRIKIPIDKEESIPTISNLFIGAKWFEQEAWDMMGIEYSGIKSSRLLTHDNFIGHPLCKDYKYKEEKANTNQSDDNKQWIAIGPSHPAQTGTLKVSVLISENKVTDTKVEIGQLHRCFEKICESKTYNQIIPYTDRLNYCSPAMNNVGWCIAVEKMLDIDIPDQAKTLRMIFAELSRYLDHLFCIAMMAKDINSSYKFWFCFEQREKIYNIFEKYCGARITVSLTRIGGMSHELPKEWINECKQLSIQLQKSLIELEASLSRSRLWMQATQVCPISSIDAIQWGYTGPCLRACGINYDIRKASPYYFYEDIDFEIPLGINGDCYDQYLVRIEEMRQSLKIIDQLLDNFPISSLSHYDNKITLPDKKTVYKDPEQLINHFSLITDGIKVPKKEIYSKTEAANGELGFYIISSGEDKPFRVKVRPPCYPILQSFSQIAIGHQLYDVTLLLNSMNIVAGELDR